MICTCITAQGLEACLKALAAVEMAEIRLDKTTSFNSEILQLFTQSPVPLVATFRPGEASDMLRLAALKTAIIAGAAYVDIEMGAPYIDELLALANENQCKTIISYHNFENTPDEKKLASIVDEMRSKQPDFLKIATLAQSAQDCLQVLSLYKIEKNLLAFCMGSQGKYSRIASYLLGAPFIYAASTDGATTADGQMTEAEIRTILKLLQ